MTFVDYPRIKQSLGVAALRDAYPSLLLDQRATICGVNPLVLWMWGALKADEPFHPERFLGVNIFTMAAQQFHRIPVELNREYYTARSAVVKRQDERNQLTIYAPFIAAMHSDPARLELFEAAPDYRQDEWECPLTIAHPDQPETMLEFQATIYRLEENGGFLLVYYPVKSALPVIEEMNSRLIERLGRVIAVQTEKSQPEEPNKMLLETGYHTFFRDYYPRLIHDTLWYLCGENEAHRRMMGMSVTGMHFFEMFLTPVVRYFLGAIQESTAPRALKYFDMFTAPYMREGHELHEQYEQTMRRLARLDDFNTVLERSRRWHIHLNSAANLYLITRSDEPFYTCRVILPWRFDSDVHLQFKSMVRFLFEDGILPQDDRRNYEITLVPENHETDVAMLLLPLLVSAPPDVMVTSAYHQLLWLLALLQVVDEALRTTEENTSWEPEGPFERIYGHLRSRPAMAAERQTEEMMLMAEIRATIEMLGRMGKISKGSLLTLLHTYMVTEPQFKTLGDFLAQELAVEEGMQM